ncbi:hypothetical protein BJY01DRAFT_213484 [Aspergillus pseudoustus]|uniref:Uncharacterized protein n=1 Tax=Aspergillus pseudoustus TaxID=1810923 RepID=A0ABR4K249_9EURO
MRGSQKKSIELLEDLARFLTEKEMVFYRIVCAYHEEQEEWQAFVVFGRENMSDDARRMTRIAVIKQFLGGKTPYMDMTVKKGTELPVNTATFRWCLPPLWQHMTTLTMLEGMAYNYITDGVTDNAEWRALQRALTEESHCRVLYKIIRRVYSIGQDDTREELDLDGALTRIKKPSEAADLEKGFASLQRLGRLTDAEIE